MLRYKELRNACLMSVMVIFLCLIALTGSTYALFTSNPEDGKIGVTTTSGTVKVDIVDAITLKSIRGDALLFDYEDNPAGILMEPGATIVTKGFKIKNAGNVLMNFRMFITNDSDIDMDLLDRSCEFYITTDPTNFSDAQKIYNFTGTLEGDKYSDTFYLVMKMYPNANNELQGQLFTGIGITVHAVQGNVKVEGMN